MTTIAPITNEFNHLPNPFNVCFWFNNSEEYHQYRIQFLKYVETISNNCPYNIQISVGIFEPTRRYSRPSLLPMKIGSSFDSENLSIISLNISFSRNFNVEKFVYFSFDSIDKLNFQYLALMYNETQCIPPAVQDGGVIQIITKHNDNIMNLLIDLMEQQKKQNDIFVREIIETNAELHRTLIEEQKKQNAQLCRDLIEEQKKQNAQLYRDLIEEQKKQNAQLYRDLIEEQKKQNAQLYRDLIEVQKKTKVQPRELNEEETNSCMNQFE